MHLIKMPSIGQYNQAIKDIQHMARYTGQDENDEPIYDRNTKLPKITFSGSVKLHGTNASVCYNHKELWAQSKGNVLDFINGSDNAGFDAWVQTNKEFFELVLGDIFKTNPKMEEVCIYGEWAGKGIQKGVAIAELPKTFYMFGIKFKTKDEDEYRWAKDNEFTLEVIAKHGPDTVKSIFEYETYEIEVDIGNPKAIQNELIKITEDIDKLCPVGKAHGIEGHGEGVVWTGWYKDTKHTFKIKGESHARSKVKILEPVDDEYEQRKIDFANYATPAWRLEQGIQETFDTLNGGEMDIKKMGDFIRWVVKDIMKEELDKLQEYNLEPKEVNKTISTIVRNFFMNELNRQILGG